MNYPHIIEQVYCKPVCITAARWKSIHQFLFQRIGSGQSNIQVGEKFLENKPLIRAATTNDNKKSKWDQLADQGYYNLTNNIAVVPIHGILGKHLDIIDIMCGGASVDAIAYGIKSSSQNKNINRIVLDINSPGGSVTGIPELAALIRDVRQSKLVSGFGDSLIGSAGYWLASQASEMYTTLTCDTGSIGVYLALLDETIAMQLEGLSLELFKEGEHKGIGLPGRALTNADRQLLQAEVTKIYQWFTSDVQSNRLGVQFESMQGQTFLGDEAEKRGLIDGIVSDWDEFLSLIL